MSMLSRFTSLGSVQTYVDDVFSAYTRTGTGASTTVTTDINLSSRGGLVWTKARNSIAGHKFTDTSRGVQKALVSNSTAAQTTDTNGLTAFGTTGHTIGSDSTYNTNGNTYVDWVFAKAFKFFDVVTYTGNGVNRTVTHSLNSVPGCIIVKRTDTTADWAVYHRSLANTQYLVLNTTAAAATGATWWNSTTPTSSVFSLGTDTTVNASGGTYVAYILAHDAGGFGLTGTDNVVSCGSFTGNTTVNLGYEPQWVLVKNYGGADSWTIMDNMRGMPVTGFSQALLSPNTVGAEGVGAGVFPTATGFTATGYSGLNCIYIAIRRGPMKVPTVGTSVFVPIIRTATGANATISSLSFPSDASWFYLRSRAGYGGGLYDRLRGANNYLLSFGTFPENNVPTTTGLTSFASNVGFTIGVDNEATVANTFAGDLGVIWNFRRAPSFFDEVCYTGDGTSNPARSISHSLGVKPEFAILKSRSASGNWLSVVNIVTSYLYSSAGSDFGLNLTSFPAANLFIGTTYVSATAFQLGFLVPDVDVSATQRDKVNANSATYVAYLFATCPGVSKVGSYTGNGSSQTINCGFTTGARFILIKRTDSTGDWYTWDSIRGIVAGNDPYLSLNTTTAEVTTDDSIDPDTSGFIVNQVAATNINVTSATYIYLSFA